MSITLSGLQDRRHHALIANQNSKQRMTRAGRILRNEWRAVWPDLSTSETEPSVENVFLEAAEDKAATAASIPPTFDVPPRRGTRSDGAETNAQLSRRVFVTLAQNSRLDALAVGFYSDWFVYGLLAALVWKDWDDPQGMPYMEAVEPRHLYPISWTTKGELGEALIIRRRRFADLIRDYGPNNPALMSVHARGKIEKFYEEIWWADGDAWGIGLAFESGVSDGDFNYRRPSETGYTNMSIAWLVEPHTHRLNGCPIVAHKVFSPDREIRGKLDPMLAPLKTAHALNLEVMMNVRRSLHSPPLLQNVENPEDWGPDAIMKGVRGPDEAVVAFPRPPAAFEAFGHVKDQLDAARGAGAFPLQRSGDPGASIASGQAVSMLQGSYNAQQSWAQMDMARFYTDCFARLASMDEQWTDGERQIDGFDSGEAYADRYVPSEFWKGDYRVLVSFHALGVDSHTNLLNMGAAHRLGWLSARSAMEKSGLVPNALGEQREITLDKGVTIFEDGVLSAQAQAGDTAMLGEYIRLVDSDSETPRSAMQKVLKEAASAAAAAPAAGPPGAAGPGGPGAGPPPQVSPELLSLIQGGAGGGAPA